MQDHKAVLRGFAILVVTLAAVIVLQDRLSPVHTTSISPAPEITPSPPPVIRAVAQTEDYFHSDHAYVRFYYCAGYVSTAAAVMKPFDEAMPGFQELRYKMVDIFPRLLIAAERAVAKEGASSSDDSKKEIIAAGQSQARANYEIIKQITELNQADRFAAAYNEMIRGVTDCTRLLLND